MAEEIKVRVQSVPGALGGSLWFGGWLFTLGYLKLAFIWKGALALILWPYYLGAFFHR
jgi:hypothetical protein